MANALMGPIICDVKGLELNEEERELLQHPLIGGVIFFARNYESPQQIKALSQSIRDICKQPMLLAVDQEGGRVQRFRTGFTRLPPMQQLGKLYDEAPAKALQVSEACGFVMASEVLSVGMDLSFAPVLDLETGLNPAINTRAFHADPELVVKLATAFIKGMHAAGMAAVGKHFPGHGSVLVDSHVDLPQDEREFLQIAQTDLKPFKQLSEAGIQGIMAAHILFSKVDKNPVGFSAYWLQQVLRQQLKFSGMIFTDDLSMHGANIAGGFPDRVVAALEAGCDMALICNHMPSVIQTLDALPSDYKLLEAGKFKPLQGRFPSGSDYKNSLIWRTQHAIFNELATQYEW